MVKIPTSGCCTVAGKGCSCSCCCICCSVGCSSTATRHGSGEGVGGAMSCCCRIRITFNIFTNQLCAPLWDHSSHCYDSAVIGGSRIANNNNNNIESEGGWNPMHITHLCSTLLTTVKTQEWCFTVPITFALDIFWWSLPVEPCMKKYMITISISLLPHLHDHVLLQWCFTNHIIIASITTER